MVYLDLLVFYQFLWGDFIDWAPQVLTSFFFLGWRAPGGAFIFVPTKHTIFLAVGGGKETDWARNRPTMSLVFWHHDLLVKTSFEGIWVQAYNTDANMILHDNTSMCAQHWLILRILSQPTGLHEYRSQWWIALLPSGLLYVRTFGPPVFVARWLVGIVVRSSLLVRCSARVR